ncbi:MAG: SPOCS domain-containing protein [Oscillospiraceae bacterium]
METILKKTGMDCYHKAFSQTLRKEETQDCVVPDTSPDIAGILDTTGCVLIRSKDVSAGRVRLEAAVPAKVAYLPEGESGLRCLDVNVPLYISCDDERISDGCLCSASLSLVGLDTRMLNPRKVMVRAEVCVSVVCYEKGELSLPRGVEEDKWGIRTLVKTESVTTVDCVTEKTFAVTDEYALPASKPAIDCILSQRTELVTEDVKTVGSKIILKGSVKSSLLYGAADGQPAAVDFSTGFSQIIECADAGEEPFVRIDAILTGAYYETTPDSGGRTIGMELHLVAQAVQTGRRQVEYLADAYCNSKFLELAQESVELDCVRRETLLKETVRDTVETPGGMQELCDAYARWGAVSIDGGRVMVPVTVCLLYKSGEGKLLSARKRFDVGLEALLEEGERLDGCALSPAELYLSPTAAGAELRLPVEAKVTVCRTVPIRCLSAVTVSEEGEPDLSRLPTLTLLRARSAEELWDIAKENGSTVEAIVAANGIDESFPWGKTILVPKTV